MQALTRAGSRLRRSGTWLSDEVSGFLPRVRATWSDRFWRSVAVLFAVFSASTVITGLSYVLPGAAPSSLPPGLDLLTSVVPVGIWGALWLGLGLWGGLSSLTGLRSRRAFIALTALAVVWLLAYFGGWIVSGFDGRGYLNGSTYVRTTIAPLLLVLVYPVLERVHGSRVRR